MSKMKILNEHYCLNFMIDWIFDFNVKLKGNDNYIDLIMSTLVIHNFLIWTIRWYLQIHIRSTDYQQLTSLNTTRYYIWLVKLLVSLSCKMGIKKLIKIPSLAI